jgi:hypothetical protein
MRLIYNPYLSLCFSIKGTGYDTKRPAKARTDREQREVHGWGGSSCLHALGDRRKLAAQAGLRRAKTWGRTRSFQPG